MGVASWIYDHGPQVIRDWMDERAYQEAADAEYEEYLRRQNGTIEETAGISTEADSIFGDRRKYNIEHDIPLTAEQQKQQDKIEMEVPVPPGRAHDFLHAALNVVRTGRLSGFGEWLEAAEKWDSAQANSVEAFRQRRQEQDVSEAFWSRHEDTLRAIDNLPPGSDLTPEQEAALEVQGQAWEDLDAAGDRQEQRAKDHAVWDDIADRPGYSLMQFSNGDRQILTYDGEIINLAANEDALTVATEHWNQRQEQDPAERDYAKDFDQAWADKMAAKLERAEAEEEISDRPWVPSAEAAAAMALSKEAVRLVVDNEPKPLDREVEDRDYAAEMQNGQDDAEAAMLLAETELDLPGTPAGREEDDENER